MFKLILGVKFQPKIKNPKYKLATVDPFCRHWTDQCGIKHSSRHASALVYHDSSLSNISSLRLFLSFLLFYRGLCTPLRQDFQFFPSAFCARLLTTNVNLVSSRFIDIFSTKHCRTLGNFYGNIFTQTGKSPLSAFEPKHIVNFF